MEKSHLCAHSTQPLFDHKHHNVKKSEHLPPSLCQIDMRQDKKMLADLKAKGKDFRIVDPREDYISTQQGQELARELK